MEDVMKQKILFVSAVALMLAAATLSSIAADNSSELLGNKVPTSAAYRTVTIGPNTTYVNVMHEDIVQFAIGDQLFAWDFNGPSTLSEIDLNKIAPSGALNHLVRVYISRNPLIDGGL
jgi:hypothetical protein